MLRFSKSVAVSGVICVTLLCAQVPSATSVAKIQRPARAEFVDEFVASFATGEVPTGMVTTPEGNLIVALKNGTLRMFEFGALLPTPVLDLTEQTCSDSERGLQGVTLDPGFAQNSFLYLYYTWKSSELVCDLSSRNRVVRYTLRDNLAVEPLVILDGIPSPGSSHNGGDLSFGADGLLYIGVGDGGEQYGTGILGAGNDNATYRSVLNGKILRINRDGSIPASNPWVGQPGATPCGGKPLNLSGGPCTETFAWGLRNPFKIAFRPGTNAFYVNDVGQGLWEEINLGTAGANYGWNTREGFCITGSTTQCDTPPAGITNPIHTYLHQGPMCAITGAAFSTTAWPDPFRNTYFFGDYCGNTIYTLSAAPGGGFTHEPFHVAEAPGGIIDLMFDPASRALYYTLGANYIDNNIQGVIRRLRYVGAGNRPPTAIIAASARAGLTPLAIAFSAAASSDPDGDAVSFDWNFGDGAPNEAGTSVTHVYTRALPAIVTLTAIDSAGLRSLPVTMPVYPGNRPPEVAIISPTREKRFSVGEVLVLSGSATDPDSGPMAASSLSWRVIKHHVPASRIAQRHTHPFFSGAGNNLTLPAAPEPEDLDTTRLGFLEIQLTATEPGGLATTISQTLEPGHVVLAFDSTPLPFIVKLNERNILMPTSITVWPNQQLVLDTPVVQTGLAGSKMRFEAWSDGLAREHIFRAPAGQTTYTASFTATVDSGGAVLYRLLVPLVDN
jgi:glucose/arabinose dehydrogenase/PKD repeat protein